MKFASSALQRVGVLDRPIVIKSVVVILSTDLSGEVARREESFTRCWVDMWLLRQLPGQNSLHTFRAVGIFGAVVHYQRSESLHPALL